MIKLISVAVSLCLRVTVYLLVQVLQVLHELGHCLFMLALSDEHFPSVAHFLHSNCRSIQASEKKGKIQCKLVCCFSTYLLTTGMWGSKNKTSIFRRLWRPVIPSTFSFRFFTVAVTKTFLRDWVVDPVPNSQPGGPEFVKKSLKIKLFQANEISSFMR